MLRSNVLLSDCIHEIAPRVLAEYRERGDWTPEDLRVRPELQLLAGLRGLTVEEFNRWCRFQSGVAQSEGERRWALEEVPRGMVFGPNARMLSAILHRHAPGPLWRVADFGAGTSRRIMEMARDFPEATFRAFEPSVDMFELALLNRMELSPRNVFLERLTAPEAAERFPRHFDVATSILCAHFAPSLEEHYEAIASSLRHDGLLVLREFVISREFPLHMRRFAAEFWCRAIAMRHAPIDEERYLDLLERCGFTLVAGYEEATLLEMAGEKPESLFNRTQHLEQSQFSHLLRRELRVPEAPSRAVLRSRKTFVLRKR